MTTEISRLRPADLLVTSLSGMRARPLRATLSAIGVGLGVAAVVAVLGIIRASQAGLLAQIDALGTNLLTATDSQSQHGQPSLFPATAVAMTQRIAGVEDVSAAATLNGVGVYRSDRIPASQTGGLQVTATEKNLAQTLHLRMSSGVFLNAATIRYPVTVLGATTAANLGLRDLSTAPRITLGHDQFSVVGILAPAPLEPQLDRSALIGLPIAKQLFGYTGHPDELFIRTNADRNADVAAVLAATVAPEQPQDVQVAQPTAALTARIAAKQATGLLLLGLGAVALFVGAIGIANTMIIAVLERRHEIGLRRALGATRAHIRRQFLTEAIFISFVGGLSGLLIGVAITLTVAHQRQWPDHMDIRTLAIGLALATLTGALAGMLPAARAARVPPAIALRD
jgi:putative ABC transport system permease protein